MPDTQSLYFSFTLSPHNYCGNSLPKWKFNFTTFQTWNFPNIHSIPVQFPLNVFYLRFSYAYLTAKQYHAGMTCWINQYENGGIFYARTQKHKNHRCRSWLWQYENSKHRHANRNQSLWNRTTLLHHSIFPMKNVVN